MKEELRWNNGDIYIGEFENSLCHGNGKKIYANGVVEDGYWENNKFISKIYNDVAEIPFSDGGKYTGTYIIISNNKIPHGKGQFKFFNGDFYEGDFRNGKIHGNGDYKGANGDRYIGGFVNHQREGKGKEIHKNGTIFEGDYVNGLPHGNGRATLPDGRTITGKWYKGEYQR